MKKQVLAISALSLLALLALSNLANATSLHPDTFARVANLVSTDPNPRAYESATVYVNESRKAIKLVLMPTNHCPAGYFCAAVMPAPEVVELPLISVKRASCGQTVYVAKVDRRPVDGILEKIVVVDNSTMICEIFLGPNMMTRATYETSYYNRIDGKEVKEAVSFTGTILK